MIRKIMFFKICIIAISIFLFHQTSYGWDSEFHRTMTRRAVSHSKLVGTNFLKEELGIEEGFKTRFMGPGDEKSDTASDTKDIKGWIAYGGIQEDRPPWQTLGGVAVSHLYDPMLHGPNGRLTDWKDFGGPSAWQRALGLGYDYTFVPPPPLSPVLIKTSEYDWKDALNYYYNALIVKKETIDGETVDSPEHSRDWYFAQTFRALGQTIHLLEDMAQPAHTRNDNHAPIFGGAEDLFDHEVKTIPSAGDFTAWQYDPAKSVSQFWDSNLSDPIYNTVSPGLAEYSNHNFMSFDTIFTDILDSGDKHYFPHPSLASDSPYPVTNLATGERITWDNIDAMFVPVVRFEKDGKVDHPIYLKGYEVDHLATVGYLAHEGGGLVPLEYWERNLLLRHNIHGEDFDEVMRDYVNKLVPKAISYSAGLINYFFRGRFEISPEEVTGTKITITNKSGEAIEGFIKFYYEDKKGNRFEVPEYSSPDDVDLTDSDIDVVLGVNDDFELNFSPIIGAANYIIVFKGIVGQEEAVIGKVFKGKFPSITELMRAINEREAVVGISQTVFYNRTTGESLGVPDGGVNVPALDALDGYPLVFQYILDLRNVIERLSGQFWSGLCDANNIPRSFNWSYLSSYNLYHIAMGDGWDWGYWGEDLYIEEILKCIEALDWAMVENLSGGFLFKGSEGVFPTSLQAWESMLAYPPFSLSGYMKVGKFLFQPTNEWEAELFRHRAVLGTGGLGGKEIEEIKYSGGFVCLICDTLPVTLECFKKIDSEKWGGNVGKLGEVIIDSSDGKKFIVDFDPTYINTTENTGIHWIVQNDESYPGRFYKFLGTFSNEYLLIKPKWNYPETP